MCVCVRISNSVSPCLCLSVSVSVFLCGFSLGNPCLRRFSHTHTYTKHTPHYPFRAGALAGDAGMRGVCLPGLGCKGGTGARGFSDPVVVIVVDDDDDDEGGFEEEEEEESGGMADNAAVDATRPAVAASVADLGFAGIPPTRSDEDAAAVAGAALVDDLDDALDEREDLAETGKAAFAVDDDDGGAGALAAAEGRVRREFDTVAAAVVVVTAVLPIPLPLLLALLLLLFPRTEDDDDEDDEEDEAADTARPLRPLAPCCNEASMSAVASSSFASMLVPNCTASTGGASSSSSSHSCSLSIHPIGGAFSKSNPPTPPVANMLLSSLLL